MKRRSLFTCVVMVGLALSTVWGYGGDVDAALLARYTGMLDQLRTELTPQVPKPEDEQAVGKFIAGAAHDAKLVKFAVLHEATPKGLAEFAQQGKEQAALVDKLLNDPELMKQMLVADGANGGNYGRAMQIYTAIRSASQKAESGVLQRLALAIALEHAVPMAQGNPVAATDAPKTIDPVQRYLHYEKAYQGGELDPEFDRLDTWNLRFVVNGDEPDWTLAWGREMLRSFRPDHIFNPNHGWRYSGLVGSDVNYGSGNVKYDRPELQYYQNILMNGGICGRRAFFGRFILRAHGIPTIPKPSRGHGALARWTPAGWVVNMGPNWGGGWTGTRYRNDHDFIATTQARPHRDAFLKVKRAQWAGDVMGERRSYGENDGESGPWYSISYRTQRAIIAQADPKTLAALGEELGESDTPLTVAQGLLATEVNPEDLQVTRHPDGAITIPAAARKPSGGAGDVIPMKSFTGGMQVFLPRFGVEGLTILRGGAWRTPPASSADRLKSSGYGRYNNWGFRAAMTLADGDPRRDVTIDMGDGLKMEFVYIKPGTFTMGGDNTSDSNWIAINTPKHEVTITKGFYMGKYPVTQAQFSKIMGSNPSTASKDPNAPADMIGEWDAVAFCEKLSELTAKPIRLPTEAEWEYACRAGTTTKYFFGDSPEKYGEYAWFQDNDGGMSHPVGQKKPNPWGLHDIYGNVWERVSDRFHKDYYAQGPKVDPTGFLQPTRSHLEYEISVPQAGKYALRAQVVTMNDKQRLKLAVNDEASARVVELPFTCGKWQDSEPVELALKQGANVLRVWRDDPPQQGVALKSFTLTPVK